MSNIIKSAKENVKKLTKIIQNKPDKPETKDSVKLDKKSFHNHMKTKNEFYEPDELILGDDFAVFDFAWMSEKDTFFEAMENICTHYNYDIDKDNKYRVVVINLNHSVGG